MSPAVIDWNNHFLVVFKPPGWVTHGEGDRGLSLTHWVWNWVRHRWKKAGRVFAHPIHRLDRGTSGLIIFAKTSKALTRLSLALRDQEMFKGYFALVRGDDLPASGQLQNWLLRVPFASEVSSPGVGKRSILSFERLGSYRRRSLLAVAPLTGRYHQIRAQLAHRGWPILRDEQYGGEEIDLPANQPGLYLHHAHCQIRHPVTRTIHSYGVSLPEFWPVWCHRLAAHFAFTRLFTSSIGDCECNSPGSLSSID